MAIRLSNPSVCLHKELALSRVKNSKGQELANPRAVGGSQWLQDFLKHRNSKASCRQLFFVCQFCLRSSLRGTRASPSLFPGGLFLCSWREALLCVLCVCFDLETHPTSSLCGEACAAPGSCGSGVAHTTSPLPCSGGTGTAGEGSRARPL